MAKGIRSSKLQNAWNIDQAFQSRRMNLVMLYSKLSFNILTLVFLSAYTSISMANPKMDPKWFKCDKDTDCIIVSGICSIPTSLNLRHEKDAKSYYRWRGTTDSCEATQESITNLVSRCQAGKCTIVK